MTVSARDAHVVPIYGARYRVKYPLFDASGNLVTTGTISVQVQKDDGAFAVAALATVHVEQGIYRSDFSATEMTCYAMTVLASAGTSKATVLVINPQKFPVVLTGTLAAGGASQATLPSGASDKDDYYNGLYLNIVNNTPTNAQGQARKILDYVGSTKVATLDGDWGTQPTSSSTFEILAYSHVSAAGVEAAAANKQADHTLRRKFQTARLSTDGDEVATTTGALARIRSLMGVIAKMGNRVGSAAGVLSVYSDDDSTAWGTQVVTTSPTAEAVTDLDTV